METLLKHLVVAITAGFFLLFSGILFVGLLITDAILQSAEFDIPDDTAVLYGSVFLVSALFYVLGMNKFISLWRKRGEIELVGKQD